MYSNNNMISKISKIIGNIYTDYPITQAEIQSLSNLIKEKTMEKLLENPNMKLPEGIEDPEMGLIVALLKELSLNEVEEILAEWSENIDRELQPSQLRIVAIAIKKIGDVRFGNLGLLDMLEVMGEYGQELTNDELIAAKAAAEAERKRKRNKIIGGSIGGVLLLVIIVIIVMVIMKSSNQKRSKRPVKNKKRK